ncbi:hypothetical protein EON81_13685 [bacterium]|nr:MAG: hypothetical protein EON81_13685 [bacterium]
MLSFLAALTLAQVSGPPFKKAFDYSQPAMAGNYAAQGDWIYYGRWGNYGRVHARTGKPSWQVKLPESESEANVFVHGSRVFVVSGSQTSGRLMEVSASTGKPLWQIARRGYSGNVAFSGELMVSEGPFGTLSGIDLKTHKVAWTRALSSPKASSGVSALYAADRRIYAGTWDGYVIGISPGSGKEIWKHRFPTSTTPVLAASSEAVLAGGHRSRLEGLDPATGKTLWFRPDIQSCTGGKVNGVLTFVANGSTVHGLSMRTGQDAWKTDLTSPLATLGDAAVVQGDVLYGRTRKGVFAIDVLGKTRWEWPVDDGGGVLGVYKDGFVLGGDYLPDVSGGDADLHAFVTGTPPTLPTDTAERQALAKRLLARYDKLSVDERRDIEKLGRDAYDPILDKFAWATREYARAEAEKRDGYSFYSDIEDFGRLLLELTVPADTEKLLKVHAGLPKGGHGRFRLLGIVATKGDQALATPTYLAVLRAGNPDENSSWTEPQVALAGISHSSHPDAVRYMVEQLRNPKADTQIRQTAYTSIPLYGDAEARKAVLEVRRTGRELSSLAQRMELDQLPAKTGKEPRSALIAVNGRYGLMRSPIFGGFDDLFVIERVGGHWTNPRFTGVNVGGPPRGNKPTISEKDAEALLKGGWVKALAGNPKLALDSDKDGLTDLAEVRLGTNPKLADSDGDGLRDEIDRNPLVAPRTLTEEEEILWTAYEARYRFGYEDGINPFIVTFPGKPFELPGRQGYALGEGKVGTVSKLFGQGPGFIRLAVPKAQGDLRAVSIGTTYGGLNGTGYLLTLKKIDGTWFVVNSVMEWIS